MRRRDFMTVLAGAAAYPLLAGAQQKAMPVIGFLGVGSPGPGAPFVAAFRQGLSEAGYVEGQNVAIEYRFAEGRLDQLAALYADLVGRKVDLIVATGGAPSVLAAKNATSKIPIVFSSGDPVAEGLVASLARPGGNLTGFSLMLAEMMPKRLELLSELVPSARVIALLMNPNNPRTEPTIRDAQEAARLKGVQLAVLKAGTESEIDAAFTTLTQLHAGALVVDSDVFFFGRRDFDRARSAPAHRVPACGVADHLAGQCDRGLFRSRLSLNMRRVSQARALGVLNAPALPWLAPLDRGPIFTVDGNSADRAVAVPVERDRQGAARIGGAVAHFGRSLVTGHRRSFRGCGRGCGDGRVARFGEKRGFLRPSGG